MREAIHVHEQFGSPQGFRDWEKDNEGWIWSPSRLGTISACPRKFQHRYVDRLTEKDKPAILSAGSVMHTGLHHLIMTGDPEKAIEAMRRVWVDIPHLKPSDEHMTLPHFEVVIRNYYDFWKRHGSYEPVTIRYEDLNTENLMAARFVWDEEDRLVLGESTLLMKIHDGDRHADPLYIKGIPDLVVRNPSGNTFVLDHKTTNGWISDWWKMKYRVSDQFRMYALMLKELLGRPISGAVLDAVYVGKYATSTSSKAVKFDRTEYIYDSTMLEETLQNALKWREQAEWFDETNYFPQNTGLYCGGCPFLQSHCKHPTPFREEGEGLVVNENFRSILDPREEEEEEGTGD